MYTFENLKEDVTKEAQALKVHATKEELEILDFAGLQPTSQGGCIYGQIADGCYSERAAELIQKCTPRYFKNEIMPSVNEEDWRVNMERIAKYANGTSVEGFFEERIDIFSRNHFSAIEAYILLPEAKNANLIAYLKGEVETLEL